MQPLHLRQGQRQSEDLLAELVTMEELATVTFCRRSSPERSNMPISTPIEPVRVAGCATTYLSKRRRLRRMWMRAMRRWLAPRPYQLRMQSCSRHLLRLVPSRRRRASLGAGKGEAKAEITKTIMTVGVRGRACEQ